METSFFKSILIFCDGACSGNPGRGGWGAVIAMPEGKVKEIGGAALLTTNNQMELTAAIESLRAVAGKPGEVNLCTDSVYVIKGITQWIWGWRKKGWKTAEGNDVSNREYWEELSRVVAARPKEDKIHWRFVRGHSGIAGNERVDEIAVQFSKGEEPDLFNGALIKYRVAIHDLPDNLEVPESKSKKEPKAVAYSYLSLLGDIPERHKTWAECERRVKGRSGAKFKKAMNAADEVAILALWGVDPKKLK